MQAQVLWPGIAGTCLLQRWAARRRAKNLKRVDLVTPIVYIIGLSVGSAPWVQRVMRCPVFALGVNVRLHSKSESEALTRSEFCSHNARGSWVRSSCRISDSVHPFQAAWVYWRKGGEQLDSIMVTSIVEIWDLLAWVRTTDGWSDFSTLRRDGRLVRNQGPG